MPYKSHSLKSADRHDFSFLYKYRMTSYWAGGSEEFFHFQCGETVGKQNLSKHLELRYTETKGL